MRRLTIFTLFLALMPFGLAAQTVRDVAAPEILPGVISATAALPAATVKRLRSAPDRFVQDAGRLIYGYGQGGAIDAPGLARYVALQRASSRARNLRSFLDADLDNDGAVSGAEIAARADTLAANARGRLRFAHKSADLDQDGSVSWDEMRNQAQIDAMGIVSTEDEAVIMGFTGFDSDKDGQVTMAEVQAMLTLFQPKQ